MASQNPVARGELLYSRYIGSVQLVTLHLHTAPDAWDAAILVLEHECIIKQISLPVSRSLYTHSCRFSYAPHICAVKSKEGTAQI